MEVKPKTRIVIGGGSAAASNSTSPPTIGSPNPNPIRIGGGGGHSAPGAGGGFTPRPPRYPRRDLSKFNTDEHRINERIRIPQVRLIDHEGNQVGIVDTTQAMQMARDVNLDLVEISPNATPPVCKILDYGKFKYEKKKKDHEAKKKQVVVKVKEVQLRPTTDEHDLAYKFKNVRTFLEEGDKAKITMMFRGREVAYVENGHKIMKRLLEELGDLAVVEAPAKLEGKKLIMVVGPNPKAKKPSSGASKAPAKEKEEAKEKA
jgi:translation initiation factor IF-3